jgi:transposase
MPTRDHITAVLGFQKYQVTQFKRISKKWIYLWVDWVQGIWRCPRCGRGPFGTYDRRWLPLRDLDLAKHRTMLMVPKVRVRCPACGVKQVPTGISRSRARCTKRMEAWLFVLTRTMPLSEVASVTDIHRDTIKDAEVRSIQGLMAKRNLNRIRHLGIDEVSEKKGHRYLTLVTDIDGRRVIWVGQNRNRAVVERFFRWFGRKRSRRIRSVVIDMHDPYEMAVRARCPRAKIVYDRFHLMKYLGLAIDLLRRRLQASLPEKDRRILKGQRYLLLRGHENLSPKQRVRLRELLAVNHPLNAAYILKEDFRALFDITDPAQARRELRDWKLRAKESALPALHDFVRLLNRRRYGIQNFFQHRITNGLSEGFNNVVKTVKKVAYGFHDSHYFGLKILRHCGRLEEKLP